MAGDSGLDVGYRCAYPSSAASIRRELGGQGRERYRNGFIHVGVLFQIPCPTVLALASRHFHPGGNASWTGTLRSGAQVAALIWSFRLSGRGKAAGLSTRTLAGRHILLVLRAKAPIPLIVRSVCRRAHRRRDRLVARAIALLPGVVTWPISLAASGGVVWHLGVTAAGSTIALHMAWAGLEIPPSHQLFGGGQGMKAIIFGAAGQDGFYLRRACLAEGI